MVRLDLGNSYTEYYLNKRIWLYWLENVNWYKGLDSIMQTCKSIHRNWGRTSSRKNGVIQLLRNKDYKVKALTSRFSQRAGHLKDLWEINLEQ